MGKSKKGFFKPLNPQKYKGNPTNIVYRSSWEMRMMDYLDRSDSVTEWASEELVIPYKSPIDGKYHRYFADFWVRSRTKNNTEIVSVIEVKPAAQTIQPKPKQNGEKISRKRLNEIATYAINKAKWDSAIEFCENRGWKFEIITENELFKRK